jgi:hypothetical protein
VPGAYCASVNRVTMRKTRTTAIGPIGALQRPRFHGLMHYLTNIVQRTFVRYARLM